MASVGLCRDQPSNAVSSLHAKAANIALLLAGLSSWFQEFKQ